MLIGFSNLRINCLVGTLPHEKVQPQEIFLTLKVALQPASQDDLSATIDYTKLAQICIETAQKKHHALIETLAHVLLEELFAQCAIISAWIRIEKPSAFADADHAFVEYEKGICS